MTAAVRIRVRALGPLTVSRDSDPPTSSLITQPRQLALLTYLLLARPRGLHARDTIVAMLWPEHDDSRARQALRNALHGLRRILGIDVIRSAGDQLVGVDYDRFICDAIDLEHQAANGILPEWDEPDPSMPFAGFHVARAPVFSEWLEQERLRLQALRTRAATRHGTIGAIDEASATTQRLVEVRPDRLRSPHDQDAYALYVRGNYMFLQAAHNGRLEDLDRSRECFERALALEPAYALAIAGLSNYYAVAAARGVIAPFHAGFGRAIELSQEALALDATLAVPHVHFGVKALYLDDDLPTALREFTAARTLDPKYAEGRRFLGIVLGLLGQRSRSIAELEIAAQLEPDVPTFKSSLAAALIVAGDLERAEQLLHETLRIDPKFGAARERLLRLLERQELLQDAITVRRRMPAMPNADQFDVSWQADGAAGYQRERTAEVRQVIATLETKLLERQPITAGDHFHPPVLRLAMAYAELGEWKKARAWKLQGCAMRPGLLPWFNAEPLLQDLSSHP